MILPLKIALGVIVTLLLGLGGTVWYSSTVAEERDEAQEAVGRLTVAVEIAELQARERKAANDRLTEVLKARTKREANMLAISNNLQEKINALSSDCTFSDDASGVLWEIYERTGGVQGASEFRPAPSTTDQGSFAPD